MALPQAAARQACRSPAVVAAPQLIRHLQALAGAQTSSAHDSTNQRSGSSGSWPAFGAAASAAVAAAAAVLGVSLPTHSAHAEALDSGNSINSAAAQDAVKRAHFADWLTSHGADVSAVSVQLSEAQDSGLGLFATSAIKQHMKHSWLGRRLGAMVLPGTANQTVPVATIPFGLSITVETALAHPQLGSTFAELLELGVIDERTAVVLMVMVERARGDDSPYAKWLQLLPNTFQTPLFFSDAQLQELSGTTLAAATAARKAALSKSWQQLKPAVQQMLQQVAVQSEPAYEDYLWATSIFWSRGLALPITYTDAGQQQQQESGSSGGSSSSSSSSGSSSEGLMRIKVLEGLVPGLDFANHSQQPKCWWEVEQVDRPRQSAQQQQQQQQQVPGASDGQHVVKLMANRACCPRAGHELTISYGDKGNEELLLLYGFAQPQNPHETLMVLCPLPSPDEWDEVFTARMELLQAKGLRPQLFLSANHFESATGQPLLVSPVAPAPESDSSTAADSGSSAGSSSKQVRTRRSSVVPDAARQVLEVFVLDKLELAAAFKQLGQPSSSSGAGSGEDPIQLKMQELGLQMAILTTFARLLELKMIAMEGEEGTGSLESDLAQLAAANAAVQQQRIGSNGSSGTSDDGSSAFPVWKRNCLLYRAGQKALVRSYITAARAELQDTLAELQALMEANGYSS